ncbi:hypothetical protein lerEdw1_006599 [Lerista edwardsae]|nr:hypothetical protein lerEdw1_006599 [Lerista edwardsae]
MSGRPSSHDETSRNLKRTAAVTAIGMLNPFVGIETPELLHIGKPKCFSNEVLPKSGRSLACQWSLPVSIIRGRDEIISGKRALEVTCMTEKEILEPPASPKEGGKPSEGVSAIRAALGGQRS